MQTWYVLNMYKRQVQFKGIAYLYYADRSSFKLNIQGIKLQEVMQTVNLSFLFDVRSGRPLFFLHICVNIDQLMAYQRYTPFWSTWDVTKTSIAGDRDNAVIGTSTDIASICLANMTSQIRRLPSMLEDSSHLPSSLKHKSVMRSLWPSNFRTILSATTSYSWITMSSNTVAKRPKSEIMNYIISWSCSTRRIGQNITIYSVIHQLNYMFSNIPIGS